MALISFPDIPASLLACLLDKAGKADDISPRTLMGQPGKPDSRQKAELYAGGFIRLPDAGDISLSPEFTRLARVLLQPRTNLTLRIWGRDNICAESNIQFPQNILFGEGVLLNQIGNFYRISAFISDAEVASLLAKVLPATAAEDIDFEFSGHFEASVAAILFAVLDLVRLYAKSGGSPAAALVDRIVTTLEIHDYLHERWGLSGFGDLMTYLLPIGMMTESPTLAQLIDGLRALIRAGVLEEIGADQFQLCVVLEPLLRLTLDLQAGMQWQRVALMDTGELRVSNRLYLFGNKSFVLGLVPTLKGKLFLSRVRPQELRDFLLDEMTAGLEIDASSVQTGIPCARCGSISGKEAVFCGKCGAPVTRVVATPALPICGNCRKVLGLSAKFCSGCGKPVQER